MPSVSAQHATIPPDDASPPLLEVRRLGVRLGTQEVLRDISLQIPAGQSLVIIGESGCGKTVLLKCLIGLIRPSSGQVLLEGRDLNTLSQRELVAARARFGFVFQNAALFDSLTVAENLLFPLRQHDRYDPRTAQTFLRERLAEVGLPESVLAKKPAELSGGMRKRVGLARALALRPEVVLYDEPTTGLDPIMSDVINELILRTHRRGNMTSVVVTHDLRTMHKVGERIVMLYALSRLRTAEPQILFDGTPAEIQQATDRRVRQFVQGEAGERLQEINGTPE
jgi:phospholipid/cholesterol/gamma-HCH transport system ATP-binding protein